jgi:hypothetical protein
MSSHLFVAGDTLEETVGMTADSSERPETTPTLPRKKFDATNPRYATYLEVLEIAPERRQQYLDDMVAVVQFALEGYFRDLETRNSQNYQEP